MGALSFWGVAGLIACFVLAVALIIAIVAWTVSYERRRERNERYHFTSRFPDDGRPEWLRDGEGNKPGFVPHDDRPLRTAIWHRLRSALTFPRLARASRFLCNLKPVAFLGRTWYVWSHFAVYGLIYLIYFIRFR